jgi:AcrR family transcriptional regulator
VVAIPRFSAGQRQRIRQAMFDAAAQLFAGRRYADVSVDEITSSTGIAKGTFYGFFASKEELYLAVVDREHDRFHERMAARYGGVDVLCRDHLKGLMVEGLRGMFDHPLLLRVLTERDTPLWVRAYAGDDPMHHHDSTNTALLADLIARGQAAGVMRAGSPQQIAETFERMLAGMLLAGGGGAGGRDLAGGRAALDMTAFELAIDLLVDGLYTRGGGRPC